MINWQKVENEARKSNPEIGSISKTQDRLEEEFGIQFFEDKERLARMLWRLRDENAETKP